METWFFADPHFYHNNILRYCDRPFATEEEFAEEYVKNHNILVKPDDLVICVGDIGFSRKQDVIELIRRLNGRKILVRGNHDKWSVGTYYRMGFHLVVNCLVLPYGKRKSITVKHYPTRPFSEVCRICLQHIRTMRSKDRTWKQIWHRLKREYRYYRVRADWWTICGHVHEHWTVHGRNVNTGVDRWGYKPVRLRQITQLIDKNTT